MDCSPPDSSVHGILQERILEWVAISSSRGSSQPRDQSQVSCIAGRFFTAVLPLIYRVFSCVRSLLQKQMPEQHRGSLSVGKKSSGA